MPKTLTNYSKNVIYKIQHKDDDSLLYVGHTTYFIKRKALHKNECKLSQKLLYKMIRENGGWECFTMIVIQNFPCENSMEARIEEDRIMREMKASMNSKRAFTTPEEKKEQKKEYSQDYRESNRDAINDRKKEHYQANKEYICEKRKEYCQANKNIINKKLNIYYQANKESILERNKQLVECECGCLVARNYTAKHKRTKKHLNNLK
jgi:hypothetical protein